jgi:hypothetical protein
VAFGTKANYDCTKDGMLEVALYHQGKLLLYHRRNVRRWFFDT